VSASSRTANLLYERAARYARLPVEPAPPPRE
jgi:hypothetical protein